ncbi:MAG: histidinol-phosphate transaminase [Balneola sp.]|nr:MAG: histidinol-phosphate transaminase [Balneola sp.]
MKKLDLKKLVRPNILNLKPYRSARDDFDSGILLDANENSFGAPFDHTSELNRYPMPYQEDLRQKIADFRGVDSSNVFVGVGSDEAIDLLFRIFCEPGKDRVLITPPTYGMYKVSAAINNVFIDSALLTPDFQLDVRATLAEVKEHTKLIFLCSPNNPTGNSLTTEDILSIVNGFDGIVIVDEAYIDFSEKPSLANHITKYPNLVILQTLSKAFGLAGIRLGIALANPEVIDFMMNVKAPYNVNKLTSEAALKGFDHVAEMRSNVEQIKKERSSVIQRLEAISEIEKVFPTDANFLIFKINEALSIYKKLAEKGVIVRYRGNEPHCENCLRLTIGTTEENDRFFEALSEILAE